MTIWQQGKYFKVLRVIAFAVAIVFTLNTIAWADGQGNLLSSLQQLNQQVLSDPNLNPTSLSKTVFDTSLIPEKMGTVKSRFQGKKDELVIHIQDAHVNYDAQMNIARIIETVAKAQKVDLINVEGASGKLNHEVLAAYPDQAVRKAVSDYFVREGRLSGPEYAVIANLPKAEIYGVEEETLYEANRQAFLKALDLKHDDRDLLESLARGLDHLNRYIFSDDLRDLKHHRDAFQSGSLAMNAYIRYLAETARKHSISLYPYTQIDAFRKLLAYEKDIDAASAESAVDILILDLKNHLAPLDMAKFVATTVSYRRNQIGQKKYFEYLDTLIQRTPVDLQKHQTALEYITYMNLYHTLGIGLFDEMSSLEEDLKNKLFRNEKEVKLDRFYRLLEIYENIFSFSLTKKDAQFFYAYRDEFDTHRFTDWMQQEAKALGIHAELSSGLERIDEDLKQIERFYEIALKRDHVLIERSVERMEATRRRVSVIVTGGFHTPGIEAYLRARDISYVVIAPRIEKIDETEDSQRYEAAMRNEISNVETLLSEMYFAPKSPMVNDPHFQLAAHKLLLPEGVSAAELERLFVQKDPRVLFNTVFADMILGFVIAGFPPEKIPAAGHAKLSELIDLSQVLAGSAAAAFVYTHTLGNAEVYFRPHGIVYIVGEAQLQPETGQSNRMVMAVWHEKDDRWANAELKTATRARIIKLPNMKSEIRMSMSNLSPFEWESLKTVIGIANENAPETPLREPESARAELRESTEGSEDETPPSIFDRTPEQLAKLAQEITAQETPITTPEPVTTTDADLKVASDRFSNIVFTQLVQEDSSIQSEADAFREAVNAEAVQAADDVVRLLIESLKRIADRYLAQIADLSEQLSQDGVSVEWFNQLKVLEKHVGGVQTVLYGRLIIKRGDHTGEPQVTGASEQAINSLSVTLARFADLKTQIETKNREGKQVIESYVSVMSDHIKGMESADPAVWAALTDGERLAILDFTIQNFSKPGLQYNTLLDGKTVWRLMADRLGISLSESGITYTARVVKALYALNEHRPIRVIVSDFGDMTETGENYFREVIAFLHEFALNEEGQARSAQLRSLDHILRQLSQDRPHLVNMEVWTRISDALEESARDEELVEPIPSTEEVQPAVAVKPVQETKPALPLSLNGLTETLEAIKAKHTSSQYAVNRLSPSASLQEIRTWITKNFGYDGEDFNALARALGVSIDDMNVDAWRYVARELDRALEKKNAIHQKVHTPVTGSLMERIKQRLVNAYTWLVSLRSIKAVVMAGPHLLYVFFFGYFLRKWHFYLLPNGIKMPFNLGNVVKPIKTLTVNESIDILAGALINAHQENFGVEFMEWQKGNYFRRGIYHAVLRWPPVQAAISRLQFSRWYLWVERLILQPLVIPTLQFLENRWKLAVFGALGFGVITVAVPGSVGALGIGNIPIFSNLLHFSADIPVIGVAAKALAQAFTIHGLLNTGLLAFLLTLPKFAAQFAHMKHDQIILGKGVKRGLNSLQSLGRLAYPDVRYVIDTVIKSEKPLGEKLSVLQDLTAVISQVRYNTESEKTFLQHLAARSIYELELALGRESRAPPHPAITVHWLQSLFIFPAYGIARSLFHAAFLSAFISTFFMMTTVGAEIALLAGGHSPQEMGVSQYADKFISDAVSRVLRTPVNLSIVSTPVTFVEHNAINWGHWSLDWLQQQSGVHLSSITMEASAHLLGALGIHTEVGDLAAAGWQSSEIQEMQFAESTLKHFTQQTGHRADLADRTLSALKSNTFKTPQARSREFERISLSLALEQIAQQVVPFDVSGQYDTGELHAAIDAFEKNLQDPELPIRGAQAGRILQSIAQQIQILNLLPPVTKTQAESSAAEIKPEQEAAPTPVSVTDETTPLEKEQEEAVVRAKVLQLQGLTSLAGTFTSRWLRDWESRIKDVRQETARKQTYLAEQNADAQSKFVNLVREDLASEIQQAIQNGALLTNNDILRAVADSPDFSEVFANVMVGYLNELTEQAPWKATPDQFAEAFNAALDDSITKDRFPIKAVSLSDGSSIASSEVIWHIQNVLAKALEIRFVPSKTTAAVKEELDAHAALGILSDKAASGLRQLELHPTLQNLTFDQIVENAVIIHLKQALRTEAVQTGNANLLRALNDPTFDLILQARVSERGVSVGAGFEFTFYIKDASRQERLALANAIEEQAHLIKQRDVVQIASEASRLTNDYMRAIAERDNLQKIIQDVNARVARQAKERTHARLDMDSDYIVQQLLLRRLERHAQGVEQFISDTEARIGLLLGVTDKRISLDDTLSDPAIYTDVEAKDKLIRESYQKALATFGISPSDDGATLDEQIIKAQYELTEMENIYRRAKEKFSVLFDLRIIFGANGSLDWFFPVQFQHADKLPPRIYQLRSMRNTYQYMMAIDRLNAGMIDARTRVEESIERLQNAQGEYDAAQEMLNAQKARFNEGGPTSDLQAAFERYLRADLTLEDARHEHERVRIRLRELTQGVKSDVNFLEAEDEAGRFERRYYDALIGPQPSHQREGIDRESKGWVSDIQKGRNWHNEIENINIQEAREQLADLLLKEDSNWFIVSFQGDLTKKLGEIADRQNRVLKKIRDNGAKLINAGQASSQFDELIKERDRLLEEADQLQAQKDRELDHVLERAMLSIWREQAELIKRTLAQGNLDAEDQRIYEKRLDMLESQIKDVSGIENLGFTPKGQLASVSLEASGAKQYDTSLGPKFSFNIGKTYRGQIELLYHVINKEKAFVDARNIDFAVNAAKAYITLQQINARLANFTDRETALTKQIETLRGELIRTAPQGGRLAEQLKQLDKNRERFPILKDDYDQKIKAVENQLVAASPKGIELYAQITSAQVELADTREGIRSLTAEKVRAARAYLVTLGYSPNDGLDIQFDDSERFNHVISSEEFAAALREAVPNFDPDALAKAVEEDLWIQWALFDIAHQAKGVRADILLQYVNSSLLADSGENGGVGSGVGFFGDVHLANLNQDRSIQIDRAEALHNIHKAWYTLLTHNNNQKGSDTRLLLTQENTADQLMLSGQLLGEIESDMSRLNSQMSAAAVTSPEEGESVHAASEVDRIAAGDIVLLRLLDHNLINLQLAARAGAQRAKEESVFTDENLRLERMGLKNGTLTLTNEVRQKIADEVFNVTSHLNTDIAAAVAHIENRYQYWRYLTVNGLLIAHPFSQISRTYVIQGPVLVPQDSSSQAYQLTLGPDIAYSYLEPIYNREREIAQLRESQLKEDQQFADAQLRTVVDLSSHDLVRTHQFVLVRERQLKEIKDLLTHIEAILTAVGDDEPFRELLKQRRTELETEKQAYQIQATVFKLLANIPSYIDVQPSPENTLSQNLSLESNVTEDQVIQAIENHPTLQAFRINLDISELKQNQLKWERWISSRADLFAGLSTGTDQLGKQSIADQSVWSAGAEARIHLLASLRQQEVLLEGAMSALAESQIPDVEDKVSFQILSEYYAFVRAKRLLVEKTEDYLDASERFRNIQDDYRKGRSRNDLFAALTQKHNAELAVVDANYEFLKTVTNLKSSLGLIGLESGTVSGEVSASRQMIHLPSEKTAEHLQAENALRAKIEAAQSEQERIQAQPKSPQNVEKTIGRLADVIERGARLINPERDDVRTMEEKVLFEKLQDSQTVEFNRRLEAPESPTELSQTSRVYYEDDAKAIAESLFKIHQFEEPEYEYIRKPGAQDDQHAVRHLRNVVTLPVFVDDLFGKTARARDLTLPYEERLRLKLIRRLAGDDYVGGYLKSMDGLIQKLPKDHPLVLRWEEPLESGLTIEQRIRMSLSEASKNDQKLDLRILGLLDYYAMRLLPYKPSNEDVFGHTIDEIADKILADKSDIRDVIHKDMIFLRLGLEELETSVFKLDDADIEFLTRPGVISSDIWEGEELLDYPEYKTVHFQAFYAEYRHDHYDDWRKAHAEDPESIFESLAEEAFRTQFVREIFARWLVTKGIDITKRAYFKFYRDENDTESLIAIRNLLKPLYGNLAIYGDVEDAAKITSWLFLARSGDFYDSDPAAGHARLAKIVELVARMKANKFNLYDRMYAPLNEDDLVKMPGSNLLRMLIKDRDARTLSGAERKARDEQIDRQKENIAEGTYFGETIFTAQYFMAKYVEEKTKEMKANEILAEFTLDDLTDRDMDIIYARIEDYYSRAPKIRELLDSSGLYKNNPMDPDLDIQRSKGVVDGWYEFVQRYNLSNDELKLVLGVAKQLKKIVIDFKREAAIQEGFPEDSPEATFDIYRSRDAGNLLSHVGAVLGYVGWDEVSEEDRALWYTNDLQNRIDKTIRWLEMSINLNKAIGHPLHTDQGGRYIGQLLAIASEIDSGEGGWHEFFDKNGQATYPIRVKAVFELIKQQEEKAGEGEVKPKAVEEDEVVEPDATEGAYQNDIDSYLQETDKTGIQSTKNLKQRKGDWIAVAKEAVLAAEEELKDASNWSQLSEQEKMEAILKKTLEVLNRRKNIFQVANEKGVAINRSALDFEDRNLRDLQQILPDLTAESYYGWIAESFKTQKTVGNKILDEMGVAKDRKKAEPSQKRFWMHDVEYKRFIVHIQGDGKRFVGLMNEPEDAMAVRAIVDQLIKTGKLSTAEDVGDKVWARVRFKAEVEMILQAANMLYDTERNGNDDISRKLSSGDLSAKANSVMNAYDEKVSDGELTDREREELWKLIDMEAQKLKLKGILQTAFSGRKVPDLPYNDYKEFDFISALETWFKHVKETSKEPVGQELAKDRKWIEKYMRPMSPEKAEGVISRILDMQAWKHPDLPEDDKAGVDMLYRWLDDMAFLSAANFKNYGYFPTYETLNGQLKYFRKGEPTIPTALKSDFRILLLYHPGESLVDRELRTNLRFDADFRELDTFGRLSNGTGINGNTVRDIAVAYKSVFGENLLGAATSLTSQENPLEMMWWLAKFDEIQDKFQDTWQVLNEADVDGRTEVYEAQGDFMASAKKARSTFLNALFYKQFDVGDALSSQETQQAINQFLNEWSTEYIKNYWEEKTRKERLKSLAVSDRDQAFKISSKKFREDRAKRLQDLNAAVKTGAASYDSQITKNISQIDASVTTFRADVEKLKLDEMLKSTLSRNDGTGLPADLIERLSAFFSVENVDAKTKRVYAGEMIQEGYSAEEIVLLRVYIRPAIIAMKEAVSGEKVDTSDAKLLARIDQYAINVLDRAGSADDLSRLIGALDDFWKIESNRQMFTKKFEAYPDYFKDEKAKESEINRLANDVYNRKIKSTVINSWFKLAADLRAASQKQMTLQRALWEADRLMGLGIAATVLPEETDQNTAANVHSLVSNAFGWVFQEQESNQKATSSQINPYDKDGAFTLEEIQGNDTFEKYLSERWAKSPKLKEQMRKALEERIISLMSGEDGRLSSADLYDFMARFKRNWDLYVNHYKQGKDETFQEEDLPRPNFVSPLAVLLMSDLQLQDPTKRINLMNILLREEVEGKDLLRYDEAVNNAYAAVSRRLMAQFTNQYSPVPDRERSVFNRILRSPDPKRPFSGVVSVTVLITSVLLLLRLVRNVFLIPIHRFSERYSELSADQTLQYKEKTLANTRMALWKFMTEFISIFGVGWMLLTANPWGAAITVSFTLVLMLFHKALFSNLAYLPVAMLTARWKGALVLLGFGSAVTLGFDLVTKTVIVKTVIGITAGVFSAYPFLLMPAVVWLIIMISGSPLVVKKSSLVKLDKRYDGFPEKTEDEIDAIDKRIRELYEELKSIEQYRKDHGKDEKYRQDLAAYKTRKTALVSKLEFRDVNEFVSEEPITFGENETVTDWQQRNPTAIVEERNGQYYKKYANRDEVFVSVSPWVPDPDTLDAGVRALARQIIGNLLKQQRVVLLANSRDITNMNKGPKEKQKAEDLFEKIRKELMPYWEVLSYQDSNGREVRGDEIVQVFYAPGGRKPEHNVIKWSAFTGFGEDGTPGYELGRLSGGELITPKVVTIFGHTILIGPKYVTDLYISGQKQFGDHHKQDQINDARTDGMLRQLSMPFAHTNFFAGIATMDNDFVPWADAKEMSLVSQYRPTFNDTEIRLGRNETIQDWQKRNPKAIVVLEERDNLFSNGQEDIYYQREFIRKVKWSVTTDGGNAITSGSARYFADMNQKRPDIGLSQASTGYREDRTTMHWESGTFAHWTLSPLQEADAYVAMAKRAGGKYYVTTEAGSQMARPTNELPFNPYYTRTVLLSGLAFRELARRMRGLGNFAVGQNDIDGWMDPVTGIPTMFNGEDEIVSMTAEDTFAIYDLMRSRWKRFWVTTYKNLQARSELRGIIGATVKRILLGVIWHAAINQWWIGRQSPMSRRSLNEFEKDYLLSLGEMNPPLQGVNTAMLLRKDGKYMVTDDRNMNIIEEERKAEFKWKWVNDLPTLVLRFIGKSVFLTLPGKYYDDFPTFGMFITNIWVASLLMMLLTAIFPGFFGTTAVYSAMVFTFTILSIVIGIPLVGALLNRLESPRYLLKTKPGDNGLLRIADAVLSRMAEIVIWAFVDTVKWYAEKGISSVSYLSRITGVWSMVELPIKWVWFVRHGRVAPAPPAPLKEKTEKLSRYFGEMASYRRGLTLTSSAAMIVIAKVLLGALTPSLPFIGSFVIPWAVIGLVIGLFLMSTGFFSEDYQGPKGVFAGAYKDIGFKGVADRLKKRHLVNVKSPSAFLTPVYAFPAGIGITILWGYSVYRSIKAVFQKGKPFDVLHFRTYVTHLMAPVFFLGLVGFFMPIMMLIPYHWFMLAGTILSLMIVAPIGSFLFGYQANTKRFYGKLWRLLRIEGKPVRIASLMNYAYGVGSIGTTALLLISTRVFPHSWFGVFFEELLHDSFFAAAASLPMADGGGTMFGIVLQGLSPLFMFWLIMIIGAAITAFAAGIVWWVLHRLGIGKLSWFAEIQTHQFDRIAKKYASQLREVRSLASKNDPTAQARKNSLTDDLWGAISRKEREVLQDANNGNLRSAKRDLYSQVRDQLDGRLDQASPRPRLRRERTRLKKVAVLALLATTVGGASVLVKHFFSNQSEPVNPNVPVEVVPTEEGMLPDEQIAQVEEPFVGEEQAEEVKVVQPETQPATQKAAEEKAAWPVLAAGEVSIIENAEWRVIGTSDTGPEARQVQLLDQNKGFTEVKIMHRAKAGAAASQIFSMKGNGYLRSTLPGLDWGTSFVTPGYWVNGEYLHNAKITQGTFEFGEDGKPVFRGRLVDDKANFEARDFTIVFDVLNETTAEMHVSMTLKALKSFTLDRNRVLEHQAFRIGQFSSNDVESTHDATAAKYVNSEGRAVKSSTKKNDQFIFNRLQSLGKDGTIYLENARPLPGRNAPTTYIRLGNGMNPADFTPQGWVARSDDPDADNVGLWLNDDRAESFKAGDDIGRYEFTLGATSKGSELRSELRRIVPSEQERLIEAIEATEAMKGAMRLQRFVNENGIAALGNHLDIGRTIVPITQPAHVVVDWYEGLTVQGLASLINDLPDSVDLTIRIPEGQSAVMSALHAERIALGLSRSKLKMSTGELSTVVLMTLVSIGAPLEADSVSQFVPDTGTEAYREAIVRGVALNAQAGEVSVVSRDPITIGGEQVDYRLITVSDLIDAMERAEATNELVGRMA
ncbi:MAG: hypothetical protein COV74_05040 [Candidatus Omnitrophica bacterium CG11_big_fil_rev_8_21_14_0_20_45_26]|uniref:SecA family profile domain-containing protein n=1 Tax=Candidatus Abzuiibacterium crystallinum TaxID=1974748 RepID=A0A2H0LPL7_9BACT|nr:MAG: hypothetical protein COV74_05040 [Candidatus Omnitrophica bacterium CG11_big_fil_rev_8_21_14_0_20_45_26]PIW64360.1 MAG: hypothetical protein COW12_06490 [Candidatus Omnitrophica bacterium CG12_big_fil_rev_8_21_14_0_65_45_16]